LPDVISDPEQAGLERLEARIIEMLATLRTELRAVAPDDDPQPAIDPEYAKRFVDTARRLSVELSDELPPQLEPEATAEIRDIIIKLLYELDRLDPERALDAIDRFFVDAEAIRHIVRDALDEHLGRREHDAASLVGYLHEALPRVSQADQARLIGISTRHLLRLAKEGGVPPRRLVIVARLVKLLRYSWTPEGIVAWFFRRRTDLDGHAPAEVLDDVGFEGMLLRLARQGRAGHGS
jgi:hypothetical protein